MADFYRIASGDWDDPAGWSSTDGGSADVSTYPRTLNDTAYFTVVSGSHAVVNNIGGATCNLRAGDLNTSSITIVTDVTSGIHASWRFGEAFITGGLSIAPVVGNAPSVMVLRIEGAAPATEVDIGIPGITSPGVTLSHIGSTLTTLRLANPSQISNLQFSTPLRLLSDTSVNTAFLHNIEISANASHTFTITTAPALGFSSVRSNTSFLAPLQLNFENATITCPNNSVITFNQDVTIGELRAANCTWTSANNTLTVNNLICTGQFEVDADIDLVATSDQSTSQGSINLRRDCDVTQNEYVEMQFVGSQPQTFTQSPLTKIPSINFFSTAGVTIASDMNAGDVRFTNNTIDTRDQTINVDRLFVTQDLTGVIDWQKEGTTINAGECYIQSLRADNLEVDLTASAPWFLNVTGIIPVFSKVVASNSDASGGFRIYAQDSIDSAPGGTNINWDFISAPPPTPTGGSPALLLEGMVI